MMPKDPLEIDASALLGPGVYILRRGGRVVFVGAARNPLARLYAHANYRRGEPAPAWLPAKPIVFDAVELRPCNIDLLAETLANTKAELRWQAPAPKNPIDWTRVAANA